MFEIQFSDVWKVNIECTQEKGLQLQREGIISYLPVGKNIVKMGMGILSKIK